MHTCMFIMMARHRQKKTRNWAVSNLMMCLFTMEARHRQKDNELSRGGGFKSREKTEGPMPSEGGVSREGPISCNDGSRLSGGGT